MFPDRMARKYLKPKHANNLSVSTASSSAMAQANKTFYAQSTLHAEQAIKQFIQSYERQTVRKQTAEKQKAGSRYLRSSRLKWRASVRTPVFYPATVSTIVLAQQIPTTNMI
jgi:hypothetical protein